ncbi:MAG: hypothetical protein LBN23_07625 [Paludibacter sp.]|nr:hypothetical protein [Paludibacter sp.]
MNIEDSYPQYDLALTNITNRFHSNNALANGGIRPKGAESSKPFARTFTHTGRLDGLSNKIINIKRFLLIKR